MDEANNNSTVENGVDITDEQLSAALKSGDRLQRIVLSDDGIVNAVIAKYMEELASAGGVPVVRGMSALSPVPKPKTLSEAKSIVDGAGKAGV